MGLSKLWRVVGMVGLGVVVGVAGCGDNGAVPPGQVGPGAGGTVNSWQGGRDA